MSRRRQNAGPLPSIGQSIHGYKGSDLQVKLFDVQYKCMIHPGISPNLSVSTAQPVGAGDDPATRNIPKSVSIYYSEIISHCTTPHSDITQQVAEKLKVELVNDALIFECLPAVDINDTCGFGNAVYCFQQTIENAVKNVLIENQASNYGCALNTGFSVYYSACPINTSTDETTAEWKRMMEDLMKGF